MHFQVLGDVRALRAGAPIPLGGPLVQRLLAALLVDAPRVVEQDTLVERLWGSHPPATATTALQVHVSRLRRALEPDHNGGDWSVVRTTGAGYALDIDRTQVDADRFERLVREAEASAATEPERALGHIESARELGQGRPWGILADDVWLRADVARIEELQRRSEEVWADLQLALGRHELIVDALAAAADQEPLRERRWEQLMLALYRCGRQAEALRAFQDARHILTEELGIEPSPTLRALEQAVLVQDPALDAPPRSPPERPRSSLPAAMTTLVGRSDEVVATRKLLERSRMVTITGSAGCGKTRLAIAVAEGLVDRYRDGVWFVDLTAAASTDVVATQIASDLGLRDSDAHTSEGPLSLLQSYLRERQLLLVLDNCEQVVADVATVAGSLLASCRHLRVLATSRVVIGLVGETVDPLTPLDTPAVDATLEDVASSPAVQLFVQRAQDAGSSAYASAEHLATVGELCRFLDGLPLAIELAAMWTRTLTPREILERLGSRLSLVATDDRLPDRQRALRATIEWSHALLTEAERVAFRRVSVFPAGFTIAGATAVIADDPGAADTVIGTVGRLVGSSLVRTDQCGVPPRYRMLESIREFAVERLRDSGEEDGIRDRELDYLVGLARSVRRDEFFGPPVPEVMVELDGEHDNVREALERLIASDDGARACRLAGAMGRYWFERGHVAEGQRWLTRALDLTAGSRSLERGLALVALAETVSHFEGLARRLGELQEAVGIIREHGNERQLHYALTHLASAHGFRGNLAELSAIRAEEAEIRRRFGDPWLDAYAMISASLERAGEGNLTDAHAGLRRCAQAFLDLGDETFAARVLMFAGILSHQLGDLTPARRELGQSADLASKAGIRGTQAHAELTLALVAMELGDSRAESLFRGCRAIFEMVGDVRCAAVCTRSLGSLALDDGRLDEAVDLLRQSIEGLDADPPALAVALADLATIYNQRGATSDAARLAAAAQVLVRQPVATMWITAAERARIDAAVKATQADLPTAGEAVRGDDGLIQLEAILDVARRR